LMNSNMLTITGSLRSKPVTDPLTIPEPLSGRGRVRIAAGLSAREPHER